MSNNNDNVISPYDGMEVVLHPLLPFDETVKACCLITKQEVDILTGEKIHCIQVDGKLLVSKMFYDTFTSKDSFGGRNFPPGPTLQKQH